MMLVTFRCPVNEKTYEARAALTGSESVGDKVKAGARRSAMWSLRSSIAGAVRQACGYGIAGSLASGAAYGATSGVTSNVQHTYSDEQKKVAIVEAFESIRNQFVWDAAGNRFISGEAAGQVLTDFNQQLTMAGVVTPYDQKILARILTEIACADGELGDSERGFLESFLTAELGTVDTLTQQAQASPLSAAELAECTQGSSRDTMLMLAWALAFTDESLAPEEEAKLALFAEGLGIEAARAGELKAYAQIHTIDNALGSAYPGGRRNDDQHAWVMNLATRIGLAATDAERTDIRFRKRYGIA